MNSVENIHNIHAWELSTGMNALTAHILMNEKIYLLHMAALPLALKNTLEHLNIHHSTLEFEQNMKHCENEKV